MGIVVPYLYSGGDIAAAGAAGYGWGLAYVIKEGSKEGEGSRGNGQGCRNYGDIA